MSEINTVDCGNQNVKKFIIHTLNFSNVITLSDLWNLYPCLEIEFEVFAKVFHQLAESKLISIIKIKNKKTDFTDYIAISNNFEIV